MEIGFHFGITFAVYAKMSVMSRSEGSRRVDVRPARRVLLQDVVLDRALEVAGRDALLLADRLVEREQDAGRSR